MAARHAPGKATVAAQADELHSSLTIGEESIDPTTWAGSIPQQHGTAPHVRFGRSRWFNLLWLIPVGFVVLISAVAVAKGLRNNPSVERFIARNPGTTSLPRHLRTRGFRGGLAPSTSSTCS